MAASATEQSSEKVAYWTGHIKGWQRSGLSQDAYCRRHDLPLSSLRYWRSRLAKQSSSTPSTPVTIVPVPLATPSQAIMVALEPILIHVGDDFRIEIRGDFAAPVLEKLVRTLTRL